jgi:predicted RNA binding protein YcfA (HicA-like mRNA interferase family)
MASVRGGRTPPLTGVCWPIVKVREVIAALENDGWQLVRTRGSHRQFRHPSKPGTVTVAGKVALTCRLERSEVFGSRRG